MQWFTGHYAPDFNSSPAQTSINVNVNDLQILMTAAHNQDALKKNCECLWAEFCDYGIISRVSSICIFP